MKQRYIIAEIPAVTLVQNARQTADGAYAFSLDLSEQASRASYQETVQTDCPIFCQILCILKERGRLQITLPEERKLFSHIAYIDFKGIYDRNRRGRNTESNQ